MMTTNKENVIGIINCQNPKSLGNPEFRKEFKEFCNKKKVSHKEEEWSHKQQCLQHTIAPILNKYFNLPSKLTNFCTCGKTKIMVRKNYTKTHRISLLNALKSYNYKCKAAKLGTHYFIHNMLIISKHSNNSVLSIHFSVGYT